MTITAKYVSRCEVCGTRISPGERIEYQRGKTTRHLECEPPEIPADAIRISRGSGYGCEGWCPREVILNPRQDGPRFLLVLTTSRQYYDEDGLSFGVGDDSGYIYNAVCRPATDEESAPLRERIERANRRHVATIALEAIHDGIARVGERPEGDNLPEGETVPLGEGQTIYGGGRWLVIGPEWIWAVTNNGADGDDWRPNNIRTGGAGAIGYRVQTNPDIVAEIRANHATLQQTED